MIWNRNLHALIPRNPEVAHDLRDQQQNIPFWRGFIESVGVVALALFFSIIMLFYVVQTIYPRSPNYEYYFIPIQLLAWVFHAIAALRLLTAGVFTIASNGYLLGFDDLKLTPTGIWQLLIAKWWVAMQQVRGWMLGLGIVQLGLVVSTAFAVVMSVDWSGHCSLSCVYTIKGLSQSTYFTLPHSLFIVVSTIGISILETACCTALGITLAIAVRSKIGLIYAIVVRFSPIFIFSFFPNYPTATGNIMFRFSEYTWFSFADAGTGALVQLTEPANVVWGSIQTSGVSRGVLAIFAVMGLFLMYLISSLVIACIIIRRSPH